MAREYARRLVSTWRDKDFRALDLAHQGLYDALCASPDISRAGVIPWIPGRLAQCSDGLKPAVVTRMVKTLTDRGFAHLDVDYAELMIRSHIRHDESLKSPNITRSLVRAYGLVMSPYLRGCIVRELARLLDEFPDYKGWPEMQTFGPELFEEVEQYPLAEGIA
jgi:hypothetical protein